METKLNNDTHKELIPNNVGLFEEKTVQNGYHYELQGHYDIWQWVLVKDNKNAQINPN